MATAGVNYRHSEAFVEALAQLGCTLLVSTGPTGKVIAFGVDGDKLIASVRDADLPMGIAPSDKAIAVATRSRVSIMADNSQIAPQLASEGRYDRVYLPREEKLTSELQCHELAWCGKDDEPDALWLVNTRFSCLATLDSKHSFVPRWQPEFITALTPEDRCHLSGLATRDNCPGYVTAFSQTDEPEGWRKSPHTSGVLLDVASGDVISSGMAMPHSPRFHHGSMLLLNSGRGTLEQVSGEDGALTEIQSLPGVTRGLACRGNLAFVGMSLPTAGSGFEGAPVVERLKTGLRCGVSVVDLKSGRTVATLEFSGVKEMYDVQLLPDARRISLGAASTFGPDGGKVSVFPSKGSGPDARLPLSNKQVEAMTRRGVAARRAGRYKEAVRLLGKASDADPESPSIANLLGDAMRQGGGTWEAACVAYERALEADADYIPARQSMGLARVEQGRTDEGLAHFRHALALDPAPLTRAMLATAVPVIYRDHDEVVDRRQRVEASVQGMVDEGVQIDMTEMLVPPPFYLAYGGYNDRDVHRNLGRIYTGADVSSARAEAENGDGRLRVGFLSTNFRNHTIGNLNVGRVQHLDRDRFEVTVLTTNEPKELLAKEFERSADRVVRLARKVSAAHKVIAEESFDLLFFADVGMDSFTYSLAFSRMAPVQAVTWGHPITTGSPMMDYFVSSELLETADADDHYTERLIRLPTLGTYYLRPKRPTVDGVRAKLGIDEDAHVFACPQTLYKFHPDNDLVLGEILRRDPKAVLVLIEGRSPDWRRLLDERFERSFGEVTDRVKWIAAQPHSAFMALLATADVALDPLVFGGGNSTYETLAVGTPVVTLPSKLLRGRITLALYRKMGFEELVCGSPEEYVDKAVRLATDRDYRAGVVDRINETADVLYEDESELRDLEAAFVEMVAAAGRP